MKQWYCLTVENVIRETPDAVTIRFSQPASGRIWYYAGQFLTLKLEIDGELYLRSYSLCSSPQLDDFLAITVKRVAGGIASNYLNERITAGMRLDILQPSGRFYLENSVKNRRHIVLIAGGSGITPLMSILRSTLFNEPHSQVSLLYANTRESDIIFRSRLDELKETFSDRFHVQHVISQALLQTGFPALAGRVSAEMIGTLLPQWQKGDWEEIRFFLCGPEGLMLTTHDSLLAGGVSAERIHREYFSGTQQSLTEADLEGLEARTVWITIGDQDHELEVPAGSVILDTALDAGLPVLYSCRRGVCGTCTGKLKTGEVRMDFNEALPDWDVQNGLILTCQAYPLTDDVQVQIGNQGVEK